MGQQRKPTAPNTVGKKNGKSKPRQVRQGKVDKAGRRWRTDTERAEILAALDANGGNVARTARELNVPRGTLACWKLGHRWPEALQLRQEKAGRLAVALDEIAWQLAALIPTKIEAAPLNHLATAFGIMVDKIQVLLENSALVPTAPDTGAIDVTKLTLDERTTFFRLLDLARGLTEPSGGTGVESPQGEAPEQPRQFPAFLR